MENFRKDGTNRVVSSQGFWVRIEPRFGVSYSDEEGLVFFDSGLITDPIGLVLYLSSTSNRGLETANRDRAYRVLKNVANGLKFLGYRVDVEGGDAGIWLEKGHSERSDGSG
jgi:hypothetical protein